ncbi:MAG: N-acetyl-D-Glu racemase DgcA, partial [Alphaproteobacteria bacterium]
MRQMTVRPESWPVTVPFVISKFSCTTAEVVVVELRQDGVVGRGECERTDAFEPYPDVVAAIEAVRGDIEEGASRLDLQELMPSGSARNAIDCALWDLEAKTTGKPVWQIADLEAPVSAVTVLTISLGSPEDMAAAARAAAERPVLKLKLGGDGDIARVRAVHAVAPHSRLSVDANEAWSTDMVLPYIDAMAALGVEMVEQPLAIADQGYLATVERALPVAADESCRDLSSLESIEGCYDLINIKLDKTGGLTEALALALAGRDAGLGIMVGCNLGTSLAMAPAMMLAGQACFIDLDGPLLLTEDRAPGLTFEGSTIHPPEPTL